MRDFHIEELALWKDEKLFLCPLSGLLWVKMSSLDVAITTHCVYFLDHKGELCSHPGWGHEISTTYGGRCLDDLALMSLPFELLDQIPEEHKIPCPTFYSEG